MKSGASEKDTLFRILSGALFLFSACFLQKLDLSTEKALFLGGTCV